MSKKIIFNHKNDKQVARVYEKDIQEGLKSFINDLFNFDVNTSEITFLVINDEKIRPSRVTFEDLQDNTEVNVITTRTEESITRTEESITTTTSMMKQENSNTPDLLKYMELEKWKSSVLFSRNNKVDYETSLPSTFEGVFQFHGMISKGTFTGSCVQAISMDVKSPFKYTITSTNTPMTSDIIIGNERITSGDIHGIATFEGVFKSSNVIFTDKFVLHWLKSTYPVHRLFMPDYTNERTDFHYVIGKGRNLFGDYCMEGIEVRGQLVIFRIYLEGNQKSNNSNGSNDVNNSNNNGNDVNNSNDNGNDVNNSNNNGNNNNVIQLRDFFVVDSAFNGKVTKKGLLNVTEVQVLSEKLRTSLQHLKSLSFSNHCLNDDTLRMLIPSIVSHTNLVVLDLHRNKKTYERGLPTLLNHLANSENTTLKVLDLNYISMSNSVREIGDVIERCKIETLDMSYSSSKLPVLESIYRGFQVNQSLVSLDFSGNHGFGSIGCERIGQMLKMSDKFKSLTLRGCKISSKDFMKLSEYLVENTSLERLILSRNQIGNDGIRFLSNLLKLKSHGSTMKLKHLDLSINELNEVYDDIRTLLIHVNSINELVLSGNNLDVSVLLHDTNNVKITMENVGECNVEEVNGLDVLARLACARLKRRMENNDDDHGNPRKITKM